MKIVLIFLFISFLSTTFLSAQTRSHSLSPNETKDISVIFIDGNGYAVINDTNKVYLKAAALYIGSELAFSINIQNLSDKNYNFDPDQMKIYCSYLAVCKDDDNDNSSVFGTSATNTLTNAVKNYFVKTTEQEEKDLIDSGNDELFVNFAVTFLSVSLCGPGYFI